MNRPKSKEERLKLREFWLAGYTSVENAAADCLIATAEHNGHYDLLIFDGTASRPCVNCRFRSSEGRQKYIDDHVNGRMERIKAKESRKQARNAAGAYVVDESKPHFEAGREYYMEYYNDDPWPHTATIRIIKRTACFVTLAHVYGSREDEPRRVKVSVDERGEYLSYGSFYYFRASSCVEEDTAAQSTADAEEQAQKEREEVRLMQEAGRVYIEEVAAAHPIQDGAPVVTIEWSECPAFYSWEDGELKLSVAAAEIILKHYDEQRAELNAKEGHGGYYKTSFVIDYTGEDGERHTYDGRYDLGDNDGGMISHIRALAESKRQPGYFHDENAAAEIYALADLLEDHTEAGLIVSVSVAPWLEEAVKARQKAAQKRAQNVLDMVDMLTDEQLAAAVFTAPKDTPDVARFFLQALARRDEKKALSAFKAWQRGAGIEALDDI